VILDNFRITDKVAIVTGGGQGIGRGVAIGLAEAGADVVVGARTRADLDEVVERIEATGRRGLAVVTDVLVAEDRQRLVEEALATFGRLDILVNNAGVFVTGPLAELSPGDVDRTLDVNVRGSFVAAQAAARHLTTGGRIISIGSNVIERTPFPGMTLYAMSKAALLGLTKGLARDLGARGITANLVSPGPIDTGMNPYLAGDPNAEAVKGLTALGRYGTTADVAATVAHLAGEAAGNLTGAIIAVDGGITA
jgi:3-oxoacyl-[acyl-carrier protein] reductase